MTTYKTFGAAVADPDSNIARFLRAADAIRPKNDEAIAAWMALGYTREEAYMAALRPPRKTTR